MSDQEKINVFNAYYNLSFKINTDFVIDSEKIFLNLKTKTPISINASADKIIEELEISNLLEIHTKGTLLKSKLNAVEELINTKKYILSYLSSLTIGLKSSIKEGFIKNALVLYPFIRISEISDSVLVTCFCLIEYVDGKKELWLTEALPEEQYLKEFKVDSIEKFIKELLFNVRNSCFVQNEFIMYGETSNLSNKETTFTYNYIMRNYIISNYGIDIQRIKYRTSIASRGYLINPLNLKMNKGKTFDFDSNHRLIFVGINDYETEYYEYMKTALSDTFNFECVFNAYVMLVKIAGKPEINSIENARLSIIGCFLSPIIEKYRLNIGEDIKKILENQKKRKKEQILLFVAEFLGHIYKGAN